MSETTVESGAKLLSILALRILALYFLFQGAISALVSLTLALQTQIPSDSAAAQAMSSSFFIAPLLQGGAYGLGFLLLWSSAPWLAKKLVPGTMDNTISIALTAREIASLVVSAFGLYFLTKGALGVFLTSLEYIGTAETFPVLALPSMIGFLGAAALFLKYRHRIANIMVHSRSL